MTLRALGPRWILGQDGQLRAFGRTPKPPPVTTPARLRVLGSRGSSVFVAPPPVTDPPTKPGNTYPSWGTLPVLKPAELVAAGTHVWFDSLVRSGDAVTVSTLPDGGRLRSWGVDVFQAIVNRVPSGKGICFEPGVEEIDSTANWRSGPGAVRVPLYCAGMVGAEPPGTGWNDILPATRRTTLRIKANSQTPAQNVLGAWFQCGFTGSIRWDYANLHFEGTEQGFQFAAGGGSGPGVYGDTPSRAGLQERRLFTNFYSWNQAKGCTARDILTTGWFGNDGAPPGETFGFQFYHSTDGIVARINCDGRRELGGPIYGAVAWSFGYAANCVAIDCYSHHVMTSGLVFYRTAHCTTYNFVGGDPNDSTTAHVSMKVTAGDLLNEEITFDSKHYHPVFNAWAVGRAQLPQISHSTDGRNFTQDGVNYTTVDGQIEVVDPVYYAKAGNPPLFSGRLSITSWSPYEGNVSTYADGNPIPIVRRADGTKLPFSYNYGTGWKTY